MTDIEVAYETNTVRVVRGFEARTIQKWEGDGWELVSQTPAALRTELIFRRPKPKSRRLLWIIGGGVLAIALATIITIGVISERNAGTTETAPSAPAEPTRQPSGVPSPASTEPVPSPAPVQSDVVLTPDDPEFAALLALTDYRAPDVAEFAAAHEGETLAFLGNIGAMDLHGRATTRIDLLIGAGDFSETSAPGPAFQFRDVNAASDLRWAGTPPDSIGVGTNLSITATVGKYEERSCLLLLSPVATAIR